MTEPGADDARESGPDAFPEVPDSPAGLTSGPGDIAVILTPIPRVRLLVAVCALHKVRATVLETSAGPLAVLEDASPTATATAARSLSAFLRRVEFVVVENRGGTVHVDVWRAGVAERELPPGLALGDAPGVVTSLITGSQAIAEVARTHPDKVHATRMGRLAALRELRQEIKALNKDASS